MIAERKNEWTNSFELVAFPSQEKLTREEQLLNRIQNEKKATQEKLNRSIAGNKFYQRIVLNHQICDQKNPTMNGGGTTKTEAIRLFIGKVINI